MKVCRACGHENTVEGAKFCGRCGAPLGPEHPAEAKESGKRREAGGDGGRTKSRDAAKAERRRGGKRWSWWGCVLAVPMVLVLAVVVGVGISVWHTLSRAPVTQPGTLPAGTVRMFGGMSFVWVPKQDGTGFWIGQYEVTQAQWEQVMGVNPSGFAAVGDGTWPVESVSWHDCQEFIREFNLRYGLKARLPQEAEWVHAFRGGGRIRWQVGQAFDPDLLHRLLDVPQQDTEGSAEQETEEEREDDGEEQGSDGGMSVGDWWSRSESAGGDSVDADRPQEGPRPVGSSAPNLLKIYGMLGNVWEWCDDRRGRGGVLRPVMGGSFREGGRSVVVTAPPRKLMEADESADDVGFRLLIPGEGTGGTEEGRNR